jgi:hypothetical protein
MLINSWVVAMFPAFQRNILFPIFRAEISEVGKWLDIYRR